MQLPILLLLTSLLSLASSAAVTPNNVDARTPDAAEVDKRACRYSSAIAWRGGGCSTSWSGKCFQKCKDTAAGRNCCAETISSTIIWDGNCIPGKKTCECSCATN